MLASVLQKTRAVEIHPFDDPRVIAGQGTAALELIEEIHDLDVILTPIGGGGLICGTAIIPRRLQEQARVLHYARRHRHPQHVQR